MYCANTWLKPVITILLKGVILMKSKETKVAEAKERKLRWSELTPSAKIISLKERRGESKKQIKRILKEEE